MAKFSAEVPKGDGWGIDEAVMEAVRLIQNEHAKSPLIPIMGVVDIKEIKIDPETGNVIPVVRLRRVEALTTTDQVRTGLRIISEQWAARKGEGATLPFEDAEMLERMLGGMPVGQMLQDDEEQKIDADLDEQHRALRHFKAVHGWVGDVTTTDQDTITDALRWHDDEHAADPADRGEGMGFPGHDVEADMWRRVDVAELVADSEEPETAADEAVESLVDDGLIQEVDYAADFKDTASRDDLDDDED